MKITSLFFTASAGDIRGLPQMCEKLGQRQTFLLLLSQFYDRHPATGVSVDKLYVLNALRSTTDTLARKEPK